jgi:ribonuclease HI
MQTINIYTDGACSGNQNETNIGGWGAILEYGPHQKELYGGESNTTNNRMEMQALLEAFKAISKPNQTVRVFSDSSYLMNCFREKWFEKWHKNNWKTSNKTNVENRDLWVDLFAAVHLHSVSFYRVKGHVNLKSKKTDTHKLYETFKEWNGQSFTLDEFLYVTSMNNKADLLANKGIDDLRG